MTYDLAKPPPASANSESTHALKKKVKQTVVCNVHWIAAGTSDGARPHPHDTQAVGGNCGWFARGFRAAAVLAVALCVAAWQVRGGKYPVLSSLIQPSIQPAKQ
jgi:hypothetical protein